jgi:hydrogenase large subunit
MATKISIDPVTRLEGHLKIEITIDQAGGGQKVVDARATGTLFRGFETLLQGRHPFDAPDITARICGVCPTSHNQAAVGALDAAMGLIVPENARLMRNLVLAADFLHSHVLHFYQLAALDFMKPPSMAPWQPGYRADIRLDTATSQTLVNHYVAALDIRRKAHEMGAVFGGRLPHTAAFIGGGFTGGPTVARIAQFRAYAREILPFVRDVYIGDVEALAGYYNDYFEIGAGPKNLLAFGVFEEDAVGSTRLLGRGRKDAGSSAVQPVDVRSIAEDIASSWYSGSSGVNPASGTTTPAYPKANGYSWLKAPRYAGKVYEVGALARMTVNQDYSGGVSVMDRHRARAAEALKIANALERWLDQLVPGGPVFARGTLSSGKSGVGLTEAPRGALGHWLTVGSGAISRYQIVTPTCWNASPRDARGVPGALEQALVGTPVSDPAQPIEVLRVVHSFDPCLSCAVHVMRPGARTPVSVAQAGPGWFSRAAAV